MATYPLHPLSLTTLFSEIEAFALAQETVFVGTPGSVLRRRNASQFEFYAHQHYDASAQSERDMSLALSGAARPRRPRTS